jgi:hypothetical protein
LANNPDITDGALKTFALMPKLRCLDLRDTRFTNKALALLEKRGIALRGRKHAVATAPRRSRKETNVEEIFAPFSRGRKY